MPEPRYICDHADSRECPAPAEFSCKHKNYHGHMGCECGRFACRNNHGSLPKYFSVVCVPEKADDAKTLTLPDRPAQRILL